MISKITKAALQVRPMDIDLSMIDEDPGQPRMQDNPGFSDASLGELEASIRQRGVKTPISVRENRAQPGRFIIKHGARRYRASRMAGCATIPGYIDNDYSEVDQVIENLQRNALTPREVANFIGRELAKGLKKGEIAQAISKSPAFVTQHANLLDLPDVIAEAFQSGRAKDVTVVSELLIVHKKHPDKVGDWLRDKAQEITRGSVKRLREFLNEGRQMGDGDDITAASDMNDLEPVQTERTGRIEPPGSAGRIRKPVVRVQHGDKSGRLLLSRRPTSETRVWLQYDAPVTIAEADICDIRLLSLHDDFELGPSK